MSERPEVEAFSAGCALCVETVQLVRDLAGEFGDVTVLNMLDPVVADRARELGVCSVPAVVINGRLVKGCGDGGPTAEALRAAGLGPPLG